jgi:methyl-accepting chemotaxis protein
MIQVGAGGGNRSSVGIGAPRPRRPVVRGQTVKAEGRDVEKGATCFRLRWDEPMHLTVARRLALITVVGSVAIVAVGAVGWGAAGAQAASSAEMARISDAMSRQWNADMLHDGIRADVVSALYARTAAERENLGVDEVRAMSHDMMEHVDAAAAAAPADVRPLYDEVIPKVKAYGDLAIRVVDLSATDRAQAVALFPQYMTLFAQLEDELGQIDESMVAAVDGQRETTAGQARRVRWLVFGLSAVALLAASGLSWLIARTIVTPIRRVEAALGRVAEGDLAVRVPVHSDDEIGRMSDALNLALGRIGQTISDAGNAARTMANECLGLREISGRLGEAAARTVGETDLAESSVREVAAYVEAVSAATGQMEAAISEIAGQTATASEVAAEAARSAAATGSTVAQLNQASAEIGEIVKAITAIAEQTNLLALNATIEAARAGEAGKGFAVVATEVKDLAQGTSRATQDITEKIATIQAATAQASDAIAGITSVVDRINENTGMIAAAVEEQSATTAEINRNVTEVSRGAERIAETVGGISDETGRTNEGAEATERAASALTSVAQEVNTQISRFSL